MGCTPCAIMQGWAGAGAFSDGKLNTGTHDKRGRQVLHDLVQAGAPDEILWRPSRTSAPTVCRTP